MLKATTGARIGEMKGVTDLKSSHESSPFKIKELESRNGSFGFNETVVKKLYGNFALNWYKRSINLDAKILKKQ